MVAFAAGGAGRDRVGEGPGRPHRGGAGHRDAGRPVRAGVVAAAVGVGGEDEDVAGRAAERVGDDLPVHGGRPVPELGRPDERGVPAAWPLRHPGPARGGRRAGWCRASPPRSRSRSPSPSGAARPRPLARAFSARSRQSKTPMLAVDTPSASPLAVHQVVALADEVAAAQVDRVDAQRAGQLVDRGLDREHGLGEPVAAERPGRHRVGVDRAGVDPLVRAAVGGDRLLDRVEQHPAVRGCRTRRCRP